MKINADIETITLKPESDISPINNIFKSHRAQFGRYKCGCYVQHFFLQVS